MSLLILPESSEKETGMWIADTAMLSWVALRKTFSRKDVYLKDV